jgi:cathepsin A (carboxypeptidase C)
VPATRGWAECDMLVHTFLLGDWINSFSENVSDLLEAGMDVLVYSGDKDFICNWRGGEAWTHEADWSGHEAFDNADYNDWMVDGEAAGALKFYENLRFLRVFDAGHMVPMNQPKAALKMLADFIKGDPLN